MSTWVAMGFTTRQTYGLCVSPSNIIYLNSTTAGGGGRQSGVHRGVALADPTYVFAMASPIAINMGAGESIYAQNYNGAGIYTSSDGLSWSSIVGSGCYPGYGVAYSIINDTLYQTGKLGGVGSDSCFKSVSGGAWTYAGLTATAQGLCVNNVTDSSVYAGVSGTYGSGVVGIWKQTAGVGAFVKQTGLLFGDATLCVAPSGNIYQYYSGNLYKQTLGVGDFNLVTGVTNTPGATPVCMNFGPDGILYSSSITVSDVYKISLDEETIPVAPVLTDITPGLENNTLTWTHAGGAGITYNIYWSFSPGVSILDNKIEGVTSPYVHSPLSANVTYYYVVTAYSSLSEQESVESNEMSSTPFQRPPSRGHIIW